MPTNVHARSAGADRAGVDDSAGRLKSAPSLPQSPRLKQSPRLVREVFRLSRLAELTSVRELTAQIGHGPEDWPLVVGKELFDNAIDIAEEHAIAPDVTVEVSTGRGEIIVTDNGPGIEGATIDAIIDYRIRASSRAGYVGPSRGQQGNALQTILAMAYALDGTVGETVIEAAGVAHCIRFGTDPIRQEPRVSCDRAASLVRNGTRITLRWPAKACHLLAAAKPRFLQLCCQFGAFNPHLALAATWDGEKRINWSRSADNWSKWLPSDPLVPHWYTPESLQRYIAACVALDLERDSRVRSVRALVAGFRGLTGTAKQSELLQATGRLRASLSDFFDDDRVDRPGIAQLLDAMQERSRPPKPESLGLIGVEHFKRVVAALGGKDTTFRYARASGEDAGVPFVVEVAFAASTERSVLTAVNWSASLGRLFAVDLDYPLQKCRIHWDSPVTVLVHVATPVATFTDRGKASVSLSHKSARAIGDALERASRDWSKQEKRIERQIARQDREDAADARAEARAAREQRQEENKKRERSVIVGTGKLYAEIAAAAERQDVPITKLTVLSSGSDPYRRDTSDGHRDGRWFADQVERFVGPDRQVHLRGLFYLIVVAASVLRPGGRPFINDFENWYWLGKACKAARWLGYVPFERIRDERNEPPRVIAYADTPAAGSGYIGANFDLELPAARSLFPFVTAMLPVARQPCRLILVGEKSSLGEVLEPIAREVRATLLLPTGEASDTLIAEEIARAVSQDTRRAVVLYLADFDPSGWQMPISVARKLQALRTLRHPDLSIELHRVALTLEQIRELDLPSTPLKPTERRAQRWRDRMGHEQTEIDALAALRPGVLHAIVLEALRPFFDFGLAGRCAAAEVEWRKDAAARLDQHPAKPGIEQSIHKAHADVQTALRALRRAQGTAIAKLTKGKGGIGSTTFAIPEVKIETSAPPPLFTTDDDFETASQKLIANRALEGLDEEEVDHV